MSFNEVLKRLKNPSTIISITSSLVMILVNLGLDIDQEQILYIVNSICSIGISIGVLNNPATPGIDNILKGGK